MFYTPFYPSALGLAQLDEGSSYCVPNPTRGGVAREPSDVDDEVIFSTGTLTLKVLIILTFLRKKIILIYCVVILKDIFQL